MNQALKDLYDQIDKIRGPLGISQRGENVSYAEIYDDERIEVIADGLGGATLSIFSGGHNDPLCDYTREFDDEKEACRAAHLLLCSYDPGCADPDDAEEAAASEMDFQDIRDKVFDPAKYAARTLSKGALLDAAGEAKELGE
jgi:hypothetical protein